MHNRLALALVASGCASLIGAANADTISAEQLTPGNSSLTIGQTVVTAYDDYFAAAGPQLGKFAQKTMYSTATGQWITGTGVTGGSCDPAEIDNLFGEKEAITFDFSAWSGGGANVSDLDVAFLFTKLPNQDLANETARFHVDFADGSTQDYLLTAVGPTQATFSGNATPANLSPSTADNAGAWSISNPFGSGLVSKLVLLAETTSDRNTWTSDYAFMGLSTASSGSSNNISAVPVPTPAAVWGGLSLMGILGVARWHRRSRLSSEF